MKITLTGATGFVGQNLSKHLVVTGSSVTKMSLRSDHWILDSNQDALIHLAGKAHENDHTFQEEDYFKVNRDLTIKLFDKFLHSNISDFFYFSSVKAAADSLEYVLVEDVVANPQTSYGKSKLQAEIYLLKQKLPEGKRLFIIRPCMIHGPGNKGNLNLLYKVVEKGIPWPLASFQNTRSFLSIDNLNFLILKLLENKDIPSGIYNFADDHAISTNELVKIISNVSGKKERLWHLNVNLINGLSKMGDWFHLPLNSERLQKLTESYVVSNDKIKTALGIKNLPVSAKKGLELTVKSFHK